MPTVKLDLLKDGAYESTRDGTRIVRSGIVSGLDTSVSYAVQLAAIAAAGIPQRGEPHPVQTTAICTGHRLQYESDSIVRIEIIYETIRSSAGANPSNKSQFAFKDSAILQNTQAGINPRTQAQIFTFFKNAADANDKGTWRDGVINYFRPHRVFTATGVFNRRREDWSAALGTVNDGDWLGLAKGYWLLFSVVSDTQDFGTTWQYDLAWMTRQNEDWSETVAQFQADGHPVPLKKSEITEIKNAKYLDEPQRNGINKYSPYKTTNFRGLFGFG